MNKAGVYVTTAWRRQALQELSDSAYKVLGCLLSYINIKTGTAYPSRETIGRDTGKSVSSVSRAVTELEDRKYISKKKVQEKSGQFSHNVYTILHFSTDQKKMISDKPEAIGEGDKYDIIRKYTEVS